MSKHKQTIWITGASSGIGKGLATYFLERNHRIVASARNEEALVQLLERNTLQAEKLSGDTPQYKIAVLDCNDLVATRELSSKLARSIDIAILCAGVSQRSNAVDIDTESEQYIYNVNFFSPAETIKQLITAWKHDTTHSNKHKLKKIVIVSSIAAHLVVPLRSMYSSAKIALEQYCKTIVTELLRENITNISFIIVIPGFVNTNISNAAIVKNGKTWNKRDNNQLRGISSEQCVKKLSPVILNTKAILRTTYVGMTLKLWIIVMLNKFFPRLARRILSKVGEK